MKKSGFTLIEMLVVLSIVGILIGMSIVAYISLRQSRQLAVVADMLKSVIMETRSYAIARPISLNNIDNIEIKIYQNTNTIKFFTTSNSVESEISPPLIAYASIPSMVHFEQDYTIIIEAKNSSSLSQCSIKDMSPSPDHLYFINMSDNSNNNKYQLQINQFCNVLVKKI